MTWLSIVQVLHIYIYMDQTQHASAPKDINYYLAEFDRICTEYLVTKAPFAIPENWKDTIIKIMAVLNVVGIVLIIPGLLILLGLGTVLAPFMALGATASLSLNGLGIIPVILSVVSLVLMIMSAPGLFKKQKKAWTLSYYNVLVGIVSNVVSLNIGGLVIGSLLGLYVLYQIRAKFVN